MGCQLVDAVVVGGGPAGLACAALAAADGRRVIVVEQAHELGGRGRSLDMHGMPVNLGPHALYRAGHARRVLASLGVRPHGFAPPPGGLALYAGGAHTLPSTTTGIFGTSLLGAREKLELAAFFARTVAGRVDVRPGETIAALAARTLSTERLRAALGAFVRVATYCDDDAQDARAAVDQVRRATKNVLYVDGGWRAIVASLLDVARARGVDVRVGAGVARIEIGAVAGDGAARGEVAVVMDDGARIEARHVVLAVPPDEAERLLPGAFDDVVGGLVPNRASCLDVVLANLPDPGRRFALGVDAPHYLSVHSAPGTKGAVVVHVMRYGGGATEDELRAVLALVQPRAEIVASRFLPDMRVAGAAQLAGARLLPPVVHGRVHLVGDAVEGEGMLLDRALFTAEAAARRIADAVRTDDGRAADVRRAAAGRPDAGSVDDEHANDERAAKEPWTPSSRATAASSATSRTA